MFGTQRIISVLTLFAIGLVGHACSRSDIAPDDPPNPATTMHDIDNTQNDQATAVFAGGCFWCTEAVFEQLEGVSAVVSGYAGGAKADATYDAVSRGITDHAEVIQITYDPNVITYGQLLKVFFTVAHDPTQLNRQGPDYGRQYRSAVFYQSEQEKQAAADYIQQLTDAKHYDDPIVTTLEPLNAFHPAEDYHQDFVKFNPNHGYVRQQALPKVDKVRKQFPDKLKNP